MEERYREHSYSWWGICCDNIRTKSTKYRKSETTMRERQWVVKPTTFLKLHGNIRNTISWRSYKINRWRWACYFGFPADCRDRLEFPVPTTYFGNCLAYIDAAAKMSELVGDNGFVVAGKAIVRGISKLKSRHLEGTEKWMEDMKNFLRTGRLLIVGGSPSFNDYGTNFGWGRPKKLDSASTRY